VAIDADSIGHLLLTRAAATPDRPFLRFGAERRSFREIAERSAQLANVLRAAGIGRGDRVGLMLPNGIDYVVSWLAVIRMGAVVVPINTGYQQHDLRYIVADSGARMVITEAPFAAGLEAIRAEVPTLERLLRWDEGLGDAVAAAAPELPVDGLTRATLSVLQYTSGTTGFPKGCMAPHACWLVAAGNFIGLANVGADDVILIMTPFYYGDFGWNLVLCLATGAELAILPKFSASTLWRSAREVGATFFYCLGTMPVLLLKQPEDPAVDRGHRVRYVSCSGIPAEQHQELERRFGAPWREAYGTTEIGFVMATGLDATALTGSGSIGRMLPGCDGRIVGASGDDVGPGEVGEFICRSPGSSLGYWNKPEATAEWRRDGWAYTGDLMRQDAEGNYYLVGRTKDMIRRGGENIAAAEVEAVLCQHPAVGNAACVAVPDPIRGEEVKAFVLPVGAAIDPRELVEYCRTRLAAFKVPRYFAMVTDFPLTPSQRIEKHKLAATPEGAFDATTGTWR
jgi:crotonobetaine/carnitine-CoA ligase